MRKLFYRLLLPASAFLLLAGCTDSDYDLDNLDKTIGIKVNDLVVPVNVGTITLNSIFDLDDSESIVKQEYNGQEIFLFRRTGNFNSDPIHINTFHVNAPVVDRTQTIAEMQSTPAFSGPAEIPYRLGTMTRDFTYHVADVDDKVISVQSIETNNLRITLQLTLPSDLMRHINNITFRNMVFQFPKGFKAYADPDGKTLKDAVANIGKYDSKTGLLVIDSYTTDQQVTLLTLDTNILTVNGLENNGGYFDFEERVDFKGGEMIINTPDVAALPHNFDFFSYYDFPGFDINYFTGKIDYEIKGLDFDPVALDDMPEILDNEGTRIRIANPQLYLSIVNTCEPYGLGGDIGLRLTANRPTGEIAYTMPEDIVVRPTQIDARYAISPEGPALKPIEGYTVQDGAELMKFEQLSDLLYGDDVVGHGIPRSIDVSFIDPSLNGDAHRFPLRPDEYSSQGVIDAIRGEYLYFAPIALADGSVIYYEGDSDNFDNDLLESLNINLFEVTADASSDLPLEVDLSAYLLDQEGNRIGYCNRKGRLSANAQNEPITITITPYADINSPEEADKFISGINAIRYVATAAQNTAYGAPADVPILSPDMHIQLQNLKVKVNGEYIKDLDD